MTILVGRPGSRSWRYRVGVTIPWFGGRRCGARGRRSGVWAHCKTECVSPNVRWVGNDVRPARPFVSRLAPSPNTSRTEGFVVSAERPIARFPCQLRFLRISSSSSFWQGCGKRALATKGRIMDIAVWVCSDRLRMAMSIWKTRRMPALGAAFK